MSQPKHTPGPWLPGKDKDGCLVAEWQDEDGVFWPVAWTFLDDSSEQGRANSSLIAAAPDLLAVAELWANAEQARHYIPDRERASWDELMAKTRAAIARAKGDNP